MNKQEIIDRVGQEKYAAASAWFCTDSVSDDYGSNSHLPPSELSDSSIPDLPREIKDWIWESEGSLPEQLVLLSSIYDETISPAIVSCLISPWTIHNLTKLSELFGRHCKFYPNCN